MARATPKPLPEVTRTTLPVLPGVHLLGKGYDASGEYASADHLKARVFDVGEPDDEIVLASGQAYAVPHGLVDGYVEVDDTTSEIISGETVSEYAEKLAASASVKGQFGAFAASVSTGFTSVQRRSINHTFYTLFDCMRCYTLSLPSKLELLPEARADIDGESGATPAKVVARYGTHVLTGAVLGGRRTYEMIVDRSAFADERAITTAVKASYGSIDGTGAVAKDSERAFLDAHSEQRISTKGGTLRLSDSDLAGKDKTNLEVWKASVAANPVFILMPEDGLIPISELASDEQRRERLTRAIADYLERQAQKRDLVPAPGVLLEVRQVTQGEYAGNDGGSGARRDLHLWKPIVASGWSWLGQTGTAGQRPDRPYLTVKPLVPGAIAEPVGWEQVWNDVGSGKSRNYMLYNPVPPPGYRALGGVARLGTRDWAKPSGDEVKGLVCVHESLCTTGRIGADVWSDQGTHARADGSVWQIEPASAGIGANTFWCQRGYAAPTEPVYVIVDDEEKVGREE